MEIYYFSPSAPCRAVLLFIRALNLDPILKKIDMTKGEHLSPEYLRLNPQHTVPLIVDDNFVLSESRAILVYLAEQYAQGSSYYPNDPKAKGSHLVSRQAEELDASKINKLKEAFEFLESFMGDSCWMAGDEITIADFSLAATISSIEACAFDLSHYKKVAAWLERCRHEMTDYESINGKGAKVLGSFVKEKLKR